MNIIHILNKIRKNLPLYKKYSSFVRTRPYTEEEMIALGLIKRRKGFNPTPEEIQKYDKYELAMQYFRRRKAQRWMVPATIRNLRRRVRRFRRMYKSVALQLKDFKRKFLKAYILLRNSNVIKQDILPSRKNIKRIYRRYRILRLQQRTEWGYNIKLTINQILARKSRKTYKIERLLKVDPHRIEWFINNPLGKSRFDYAYNLLAKFTYRSQVPGALPIYQQNVHAPNSKSLYPLPKEDIQTKQNIHAGLELDHEEEDELMLPNLKYIRINDIAKQEYKFHQRRKLRTLPWGMFHKYRVAHLFMNREVTAKAMRYFKQKGPKYRMRAFGARWRAGYHGFAELISVVHARYNISRVLLAARFPSVYAFLFNQVTKSYYIRVQGGITATRTSLTYPFYFLRSIRARWIRFLRLKIRRRFEDLWYYYAMNLEESMFTRYLRKTSKYNRLINRDIVKWKQENIWLKKREGKIFFLKAKILFYLVDKIDRANKLFDKPIKAVLFVIAAFRVLRKVYQGKLSLKATIATPNVPPKGDTVGSKLDQTSTTKDKTSNS